MGYSSSSSRVRVDIFKASGKWYETASIDMNNFYRGLINDCVLEACENEFKKGREGEWPITSSPSDWLKGGGYLVCADPYHEHSYPIMLTHRSVNNLHNRQNED